jgi:hypothetical protein
MMSAGTADSRWIFVIAFLAVLLVAAGLRFSGLSARPVGLHYDEAANGILAGEIARGLKMPIFIPSYTGKEALFFYWAALWMKVSGITPLALRLAAASTGLVTVAVTVWVIYELLHHLPEARWIALAAAALLATSFWHLVLSRYGFRAITQPLLQALTVASLWRGLRIGRPRTAAPAGNGWLLVAGLFCGLTAYTYLAARVFPIPLTVALVAFLILGRHEWRERLWQLTLFVAVAALALAPLGYYWLTHPGSFMTRARQVAADNLSDVWEGTVACLRMFFLQGDPYIRFNLPHRPLFTPVVAPFFVLGLLVASWRLLSLLRDPHPSSSSLSLASWILLLVLTPLMLLPSAVATDEITPSNLRAVGLLPFVYVFPALGMWAVIHTFRRLLKPGQRLTSFLFPLSCFLLLFLSAFAVVPTYAEWASSSALYYAADGDLVDIAAYLNRADLTHTTPYVASRHYRHPTLAFLAEDYDRIRWLTGGRTLVFPSQGDALFLFPRSVSESLGWVQSILPEETLTAAPLGPDGAAAFYAYQVPGAYQVTPARSLSANLGRLVRLLGYQVLEEPCSGDSVEIAVWWDVVDTPDQRDYRPVLRLADQWGFIWGETQPFHYASEQWTTGERIVDYLSIPVAPGAPPGDYAVRFALYSPGADARLPVLNEAGAYAGTYVELPLQLARAKTSWTIEELSIRDRFDAHIDGLTLLGANLDTSTARPGEPLYLTLFWRADKMRLPSYDVSLQLDELSLYQGDPVHGTYPFGEWAVGEVVADRHDSRLPLDTPPGRHPVRVSVAGTALELGHVTVQRPERTFEVPPIAHSLGVTLGERVELLGYDLSTDSVSPGETLVLTLTWRATVEMDTDYAVFTHLLAPDGSMTGQRDGQPVDGSYPTSLWLPGEIVQDVYEIPVRLDAAPGEQRLEVGMYVAQTGTRLPVESLADDAVTLQAVTVTE